MKPLLLSALLSLALLSDEPSYEVGAGIMFLNYPSYMGSQKSQQLLVPIPELTYQSQKTTIDKEGIEQRLFGIHELTVDLSLGGSLPVDSQSAKAREGMPDLDLAFELGPRLKYRLYHTQNHQLLLRLPIRAVITTNFKDLTYRGYLITPHLKYQYKSQNIEFSYISGPLYSSQKYNQYFYGVSNDYISSTRDFYHAQAGYSGYRNSIGFKQQHGSWRYGGFIAHFDLHGTTFEESPLIETKEALFFGSYLSYIFYSH